MTEELPIGPPVAPFTPRLPQRVTLHGRFASVEPIDPERHGPELYTVIKNAEPAMWTYMAVGPFASERDFLDWLTPQREIADPLAFAVTVDGRALGMACLLRIEPQWATCEVGAIWYAPALKQTPASTEAMYLLAQYVFEDLGYRRYEWKCDALNAASRRTAERLGFSYEGLLRQHMVYKGRNRDTAWYAMTDADWPAIKTAFETWLRPDNFEEDGRQWTPHQRLRTGPG